VVRRIAAAPGEPPGPEAGPPVASLPARTPAPGIDPGRQGALAAPAPDAVPAQGTASAEPAAPALAGSLAPVRSAQVPAPAPAPEPGPAVPAWQANAAPFEAPADQALLAVLLDVAAGEQVAVESLAEMKLPLGFVIASDLPDASGLAARLNAAGFEVYLRAAGPEALDPALPADEIATRLERALGLVPAAVGLFDDGGSLARDIAFAEAVAAVLARRGHAVVTTLPEARNVMVRVAAAAGVPHMIVDRALDAASGPAGLGTSIDRTAFVARTTGLALATGPATAATIAAVIDWWAQRTNRLVALAPGTAVLARQTGR
jgi:polysaccharide deacetylase 2 family uncharacterized protein YibQ